MSSPVLSQTMNISEFRLAGVSLGETTYQGQSALEMRMPPSAYQDPTKETLTDRTCASLRAWLCRHFLPNKFGPRFENIYLRPANSVADDQIRRNHTVQYFAYPDYVFHRLRKESPEAYETYADIAPGRWLHMKIVVSGDRAQLYLDNKERPALLVNDLKLGVDQRGGVGIWIETGTIAHFRNLHVTHTG